LATENGFKPNAESIAAKNPKIDLKVVEEARSLIAERRANGRQQRGYDLASPHLPHPAEVRPGHTV
jgi:hypothetical protein